MTCAELERAFKELENEEEALKIRLVYFIEGVLIRAKSNVAMNLDYFDLIDDMGRFNNYPWGAISLNNCRIASFLLLLG